MAAANAGVSFYFGPCYPTDGVSGMASNDDGGCLFLVMAVGVGLFLYSDSSWSNSLWYSFKYDVGFDDVQTETKPKDCDFMQAPLGLKGCSYKVHVRVYNADKISIAGENPPTFGKDVSGKPIISYDGGKNWNWYVGTNVADPSKAKSVSVYWLKESS